MEERRDSASHEIASSEAQGSTRQRRAQFSRTRKGCERCRARRRKCDENKPRCRRCVDAKVECHYVTRMLLHDANSSTKDNTLASTSTVHLVSSPPLAKIGASSTILSPTSKLAASESTNDLSTASDNSADGEVYLLQQYIQCIAPMLDMFDRDKTFADLVPRLGQTSPPVSRAILQLSAAYSGCFPEVPARVVSGKLARHDFGLTLEQSATQTIKVSTALALEKVELFMAAVPDSWEPVCSCDGGAPSWVLSGFDDPSHAKITLAVAALMSRLDLAYSLVYQVAPPLESIVLQETIFAYTSHVLETDGLLGTMDAALRCIVILTDATKLCFGPPEREGRATFVLPEYSVDKWRRVMDDLFSWHSQRPFTLQALLEKEDQSTPFPAIVFTSAAGAWANMMYHVSVMILLTHKPASVGLRSEYPAARAEQRHLSGLWHAQQVCSIAMCSDSGYWDPCMIAGFYLAAQRMTEINQQKQLIACLQRVGQAGWRIGGLITRLEEEWCLPPSTMP